MYVLNNLNFQEGEVLKWVNKYSSGVHFLIFLIILTTFFFFPELFTKADLILPADSWICNMLALCRGEFVVRTGRFQLIRDSKTLAIRFFNSNQTLTNATSPCGIGSLANTDEGAFTPPGRLELLCSAEPLTADNFDLEAQ